MDSITTVAIEFRDFIKQEGCNPNVYSRDGSSHSLVRQNTLLLYIWDPSARDFMKWLSSPHRSYTSPSCLSLLAGLWHCCVFILSVSFYSSHVYLCRCPEMAGMPLTCFNRYAETLWLKLLLWQKNLSWAHAKRDVHPSFAVHHSKAVVGNWEHRSHCSVSASSSIRNTT